MEHKKGFYNLLSQETGAYKGNFDRIIKHGPNLFKLMCELLDEEINPEDRRMLGCAIGYFAIPSDIIPEDSLGAVGYIDDLYVCSHVLMHIRDKYDMELLAHHWEGDEDLAKVLENTFEVTRDMFEQRGLNKDILDYIGLE